MKKIIRLTESDLIKLVKRVIKEQEENKCKDSFQILGNNQVAIPASVVENFIFRDSDCGYNGVKGEELVHLGVTKEKDYTIQKFGIVDTNWINEDKLGNNAIYNHKNVLTKPTQIVKDALIGVPATEKIFCKTKDNELTKIPCRYILNVKFGSKVPHGEPIPYLTK